MIPKVCQQATKPFVLVQSFLTFPALEAVAIYPHLQDIPLSKGHRVIGTLAGFNLLGGLCNGEVFPNEQINIYLQAFPT